MVVRLLSMYLSARRKVEDFIKSERGGSEIIAVVLIIGIVLLAAVLFHENLINYLQALWQRVIGKEPAVFGPN